MAYNREEQAPLTIKRLYGRQAFAEFGDQWRELERYAFTAAQRYDDLAACLDEAPGALTVLLAYRGDRLVAAWPFMRRAAKLHSFAHHLTAGTREEYTAPLVLPGEAEAVQAMFAEALSIADILELYNMPAGTITDIPGKSWQQETGGSPVTSFGSAASFDEWLAGKSKSFRAGLRQDRKRLRELGSVHFAEIDRNSAGLFVEDLMVLKRDWLEATGKSSNGIASDRSEAVYRRLVGTKAVRGFALLLDDKMVAGCVCLISPGKAEFFATVYDPAFKAFSPGNLLIEDLGRWCVEHGLDLDYRITRDPYKLRWSDRLDQFQTLRIATTKRGRRIFAFRATVKFARRVARGVRKIIRGPAKSAPASGPGHTAQGTSRPSSA